MKIDVHFTPSEIRPSSLSNRTVVVIDVLRASSSMVVALDNQAKEIIPVSSVAEAKRAVAQTKKGKTVLCGERKGKRVPGFDLGNSPLEFEGSVVKGKTLVMATTNGTKAINRAVPTRALLVGCFLNVDSVANRLMDSDGDLTIVCSGKEGRYSLEDSVCAGMVVFRLECKNASPILSDAARAASAIYREWSLKQHLLLQQTEHGRYLASLGLLEDLLLCGLVNRYDVVPVYRRGRVVKG